MTKNLPPLFVWLNSKTCVNASDITLLEAEVNYTKVYFIDQKSPLIIATTLKRIVPILEAYGFIRVHRKYMLNVCYLDKTLLAKEMDTIVLLNDIEIKVSRRKKGDLKRKLQEMEVLAA